MYEEKGIYQSSKHNDKYHKTLEKPSTDGFVVGYVA